MRNLVTICLLTCLSHRWISSSDALPTSEYYNVEIGNNNIHVDASQRPFYNIAHMANSIKKTISFLSRGANAVEVDVEYQDDDIYLYHGQPCDCFRYCWDREPLGRYLEFVNKVTSPPWQQNLSASTETSKVYLPNFTVLYFDNKLKNFGNEQKFHNGVRFANYLARFFFGQPGQSRLKLVVSIYYIIDEDFLVGFITRLKELRLYDNHKDQIGYDLGTNTDAEEVAVMWRRLNVTNIWQGEGISNCFNPIIAHTLDRLIGERDNGHSNLTKVYRWTVDLTDSIRDLLRHNIDGVMTNHPERVLNVLKESEFVRFYRMATEYDDPFAKHAPHISPDWTVARDKSASSLNLKSFTRIFSDIRNSFVHFLFEWYNSIF